MLKEVDEEVKNKFNKVIKIFGKKYLQKGEQISMRTLQEIYEDRLMTLKRSTNLPQEMVKEAEEDWARAKKEQENKERRQKENAAATGRASRKSQQPTPGSTSSRQDESAAIRTIPRHPRGNLVLVVLVMVSPRSCWLLY